MSQSTSTPCSITLMRLLHRIDCKATLQAQAQQHGCTLKRIRRSKNWLLTGHPHALMTFSAALHSPKTTWICTAIGNALPTEKINLSDIIAASPAITVNALMIKTGCTLIDARRAIDCAEAFT